MRNEIRDAVYTRLAAATGLTSLLADAPAPRDFAIYHQEAPELAKPPYVIFFRASGIPDNLVFKKKPDQNEIWNVQGVCQNDADAAGDIADEIFDALWDAPLAPSGLATLWCRHSSDIDYAEVKAGDRWIYLGHQWRLVMERTA